MKNLESNQVCKPKKSVNVDEGKEKIKEILKTLHFQRKKWREDGRNALCWSFYCVNDNKPMDVKCFQLMKCIFCYANSILITNSKTQVRKGLILYNIANRREDKKVEEDFDFLDDGDDWYENGQKVAQGDLHPWCVSCPSALICSIETVSCGLQRFCHISSR